MKTSTTTIYTVIRGCKKPERPVQSVSQFHRKILQLSPASRVKSIPYDRSKLRSGFSCFNKLTNITYSQYMASGKSKLASPVA